MRYSDEQRQAALESCDAIGVSKTSEEFKISLQTLYKWVRQSKENDRPDAEAVTDCVAVSNTGKAGTDKIDLVRTFMEDDKMLLDKVAALEKENGELRQRNETLKRALLAFME